MTLLDPGKPPRELLRYQLVPGAAREFRVEQRLTLFEGDQARGSVEVQAPLVVTTANAHGGGYALQIQLGPASVLREGAANAIGWGGPGRVAGEEPGRLLARVTLTRSGAVEQARIVEQAGSELIPLYETLLELDAPPSQAVGVGARWHTTRGRPGATQTETEYEVVHLVPARATFRVQRQQIDGTDTAGVRAVGEWTFAREAWPPTGHDQMTTALPESGPAARVSVRFAVTNGSDAAHAHTQTQGSVNGD
ncbi:MAG TPA: hypothetical protein VFU02_10140 [Polyangiaceae bacterium]|nr:hypothetical protein [Polyangiaceae bacterium]